MTIDVQLTGRAFSERQKSRQAVMVKDDIPRCVYVWLCGLFEMQANMQTGHEPVFGRNEAARAALHTVLCRSCWRHSVGDVKARDFHFSYHLQDLPGINRNCLTLNIEVKLSLAQLPSGPATRPAPRPRRLIVEFPHLTRGNRLVIRVPRSVHATSMCTHFY
jgi:hypothetical protein